MAILHRDKKTGDYFIESNGEHFRIERGCIGWNIYKEVPRRGWTQSEYLTTCETLKEVRETL